VWVCERKRRNNAHTKKLGVLQPLSLCSAPSSTLVLPPSLFFRTLTSFSSVTLGHLCVWSLFAAHAKHTHTHTHTRARAHTKHALSRQTHMKHTHTHTHTRARAHTKHALSRQTHMKHTHTKHTRTHTQHKHTSHRTHSTAQSPRTQQSIDALTHADVTDQ